MAFEDDMRKGSPQIPAPLLICRNSGVDLHRAAKVTIDEM